MLRIFVAILAAVAIAQTAIADDKKPPVGKTSNDNVAVEATAFTTKEQVQAAVGAPLDEGFIVVEVLLTPKGDQTVEIDRDDFFLLSSKDGQRSTPFAPTQIAGSSGMVVSTSRSSGEVMAQERRQPWGGIGGRTMGGLPTGGGSIGSSTADTTQAVARTIEDDGTKREDPLLKILKEKILPQRKETSTPLTGQLYFLLEGKHKIKHLELFYKAPGGRLSLKFVR